MTLPSGLGAGGRGKEKAPCRYLHFEVDWTESDGNGYVDNRLGEPRKRMHKLGIGLGPSGKETGLVSSILCVPSWVRWCLRMFVWV